MNANESKLAHTALEIIELQNRSYRRDKSKTLTAPAAVATTKYCEQVSRLTTSSELSGSGNNCLTVPYKHTKNNNI